MKIFYFFLIVTIVSACGSTNNKPVEMSESSPKMLDSTIDKEKFDTRWVDDITEMADTDDWIILKDDDHFTLIQVLKSRTNRHYILYSKNAGFDINGLAYMKIQSPSCLDIHVYKCNIDKLNFSIKDAYSTDFAFKKLNTFLNDELLKFRSSTKIKKTTPKVTGQVDELPNEEEWDLFWIDFKNAFDRKDKIKIVTLTSKQFFDGGGGETIEEWLNNIAFSKAYTEIKKDLAKGVKKINNENGAYYKATGQGEYGDLYFDYKNGTWQFGGIVGD